MEWVEVLCDVEERFACQSETCSGGDVDVLAADRFDDLDGKI